MGVFEPLWIAVAWIAVGVLALVSLTAVFLMRARHAALGPARPSTLASTTSHEEVHMTSGTFGTAINCIDGRAQAPVSDWVKVHGHVTYVDTATIPGADHVLAEGQHDLVATLRRNIEVSVHRHHSAIIAVAGHHDCAANPVSAEEHQRMIRAAVAVVHGWGLPVRVVGLWVNDWWQVEVVADTHSPV